MIFQQANVEVSNDRKANEANPDHKLVRHEFVLANILIALRLYGDDVQVWIVLSFPSSE